MSRTIKKDQRRGFYIFPIIAARTRLLLITLLLAMYRTFILAACKVLLRLTEMFEAMRKLLVQPN